jgi:outer membrane protein assembly factor BamB
MRLLLLSAMLCAACNAHAQEWTRFRGPNGTGISPLKGIPQSFTKADFKWTAELPGAGHSSPVLWGKRLFVTQAEETEGRRHLLCLDADTGRTLWTKTFSFKSYTKHKFNTSASSTPCVDAHNVYVVWDTQESYEAAAFDHNGKEVWKRSFGAHPTQHGGATSPIVVDGLLIVQKEPEEAPGAIFALDTKTGETRWKLDRPALEPATYSAPILFPGTDGKEQLLFASTGYGITAVDPKTGTRQWETGKLFALRTVGSLVSASGLLIITSGNGAGSRAMCAVSPGASSSIRYKLSRGTSYVPTPLAVGSRVYYLGDNGVLACTDAATGRELWAERVGVGFFGSPILVDGRIFAVSTKGQLIAVQAGDTYTPGITIDLGEPSHSTPAAANGTIYFRTQSHLYALPAAKNQPSGRDR